MSKQEILSLCRKENVQFINLQFSDLHGMLKAISIPFSKLEEVIDNNIWFDGSSVEGFTRIFESDMYLKPDLLTFAIIPWTKGGKQVSARIICDVYTPDDRPFQGDPRNILKKQLEKARDLGYKYNIGPELEFFLLHKDEQGDISLDPQDNAGYFDQETDLGVSIRQEMTLAMQEMNIDVEALHHEVAYGQHEIDFRYGDALSVADQVMTFKYVVKSIANKYNLHATFMPKPIAGINGSGMHVHQSFSQNGQNIFYEEMDEYFLSSTAKSFIAGQLAHVRALNAIMNPTVNSYKRLVPGYEAPIYIAWGKTNRSALIRIPRVTAGRTQSVRCEIRCPDPSCNPYLAFAALLAAGLDGIKNEMEVPNPVEENIYHLNDSQVREKNIGTLSENLNQAIENLKEDKVIRDALGEDTFHKYYAAKKQEWKEYSASVSEWEIDRYMAAY